MGETDLLDMLAVETDRRCTTLIEGVEGLAQSGAPDSDRVEELRVEAHGLKGAALVVGQDSLADLAKEIEAALAARLDEGTIGVPLAAKLVAATSALHEGAQAAADGTDEPPAIATALEALRKH
jgi:chemotaxis protein histidine kinase CheA